MKEPVTNLNQTQLNSMSGESPTNAKDPCPLRAVFVQQHNDARPTVLLPYWTSLMNGIPEVPGQSISRLPPIVVDKKQGVLRLDLFPLLPFDRILMAAEARDRIEADAKRPEFKVLAEELRVLANEGVLEFRTLEPIAQAVHFQSTAKERVKCHLRCLNQWLRPVCRAIDQWRAREREMTTAFHQDYGLSDAIPHGPKTLLYAQYGILKRCEANLLCQKVHKYASCRGSPICPKVQDMTRIYLSHVTCNALLGEHFDCAVCDWPNFDSFYARLEQVSRGPQRHQMKQRTISRQLARLLRHDFQWLAAEDFAKMVNNPRIQDFRTTLNQWAGARQGRFSSYDLARELTDARAAVADALGVGQRRLASCTILVARCLSVVPGLKFPMVVLETLLEYIRDRQATALVGRHCWYLFLQMSRNRAVRR